MCANPRVRRRAWLQFCLGYVIHSPFLLTLVPSCTPRPFFEDPHIGRQRNSVSSSHGWDESRPNLSQLSCVFGISDTGIHRGVAHCISCGTFGEVSAVVTFHFEVQYLRLLSACQWDEVVVHETEDAITDLLELSFTLSRRTPSRTAPAARCPWSSLSAQRW